MVSESDDNDDFFDALEDFQASTYQKSTSKPAAQSRIPSLHESIEEQKNEEEPKEEEKTQLIDTTGAGGNSLAKRSPSLDANAIEIADNSPAIIPAPGSTDEPLERDQLPFLKDPNSRPSLWTIIKDMVGKDIGRFAVPVYFNDPTSLLQKCA